MIKVSLIVAAAENGIIGKDNDMPWKISSDLKYFKKVTLYKPVIMGRKTYDSIGKPLPDRPNIVITRDTTFTREGVITAHTLEMALDVASSMAEAVGQREVMIIGGAQIYALSLPIADRLYLTRIHAEIEGDTSFPDLDEKEWLEYSREDHEKGEKDSHDYSFIVLDRL
ncbi:MAG: dihydrofolate reductase [Emcibacteraceae bacterium]|nr:dihydrofolate reductase [Emcibacteraceae bacterium]MDG1858582.1 dihydrofolate reductase [Emcibacteraceae bacterium]